MYFLQKNHKKYLVVQKKAVSLQRNLRKSFRIVFRRHTKNDKTN